VSEAAEATAEVAATAPLTPLPTDPDAVFIVGVARSGTTLMRGILDKSERVAMARENHYLGHYFGRRGARHIFREAGDFADDDAIRRIVAMIYDGEFRRHSRWRDVSIFWRWLVQEVPRDEVERRLLAADRTERGLFVAFLRLYADLQNKPVIGEKTPTHLGHVDTLLEWFPNARVIHMLRDPRAIYVSDRHRRRTKGRPPYSYIAKVPLLLEAWLLVMTIFSWHRALKTHARLARAYPGRYTLLKFEDLVRAPEATLSQLSEFLGVEVKVEPESVRVVKGHGMRSSEEGIDPAAADRWRQRLHPVAKRILELFLGTTMRRHGYAR
jgi:hypothetical protein